MTSGAVRDRVDLTRLKSKEMRELAGAAQEAGWRLEFGTNGHLKIFDLEDRLVTTVPCTPSDYRGSRNLAAQLRRAGLDLHPDKKRPKKAQPVDEVVDEYAEWAKEQRAAPVVEKVDHGPKRPGDVVREVLRSEPGKRWTMQKLVDHTGLEKKQVSNAVTQAVRTPGFVRPERGVVMYEPKIEKVKVTYVEPTFTPPTRATITAEALSVRPRTTSERRTDWEQEQREAVDRLAKAEAKARAEGKAELPVTFETITTDRLGRLVLKDEFGDIWLAAPVRVDLADQ